MCRKETLISRGKNMGCQKIIEGSIIWGRDWSQNLLSKLDLRDGVISRQSEAKNCKIPEFSQFEGWSLLHTSRTHLKPFEAAISEVVQGCSWKWPQFDLQGHLKAWPQIHCPSPSEAIWGHSPGSDLQEWPSGGGGCEQSERWAGEWASEASSGVGGSELTTRGLANSCRRWRIASLI